MHAQVAPAVAAGAASGRPFNLVMMDINMPRMGGDAACAGLRAGGATLPVLAVSGTSEGPEFLRRAGFTALLPKPFTLERLRGALVAHTTGSAT